MNFLSFRKDEPQTDEIEALPYDAIPGLPLIDGEHRGRIKTSQWIIDNFEVKPIRR